MPAALPTSASITSFGAPASIMLKAMLSRTVMCGYSA